MCLVARRDSRYESHMKKLIFATLVSLSTFSALAQCTGETRVFPSTDPVDQSEWRINTKMYAARAKEAPVVFVLPPIVGETVLDRRMAARFCANGLSAYIVEAVRPNSAEREINDLGVHDESYQRALAAVRHLISRLDADAGTELRYGLLGMSLGGMFSTFVAGSEPRIAATVIVASGGDVPSILATSDQESVAAQRSARLKTFGLANAGAYEELLRGKIPSDPLSVAGNIAPGSLYMFLATNDTTVPTRNQRLLRAAIRDPLVFAVNSAHATTLIKASTLHAGKITSFLAKRLRD